VLVAYREGKLEIDVRDDGNGAGSPDGGHGLAGMRDRVALYGGELKAGPSAGGGYRVSARFPLTPQ
jgi:signal transduction histidine kinase